jgi:hypothetical protein
LNAKQEGEVRRLNWLFTSLAVISFRPAIATASSIFVDIPGITGETPVAGYPNALATQSITVFSNGFSVVRRVDVATPQIVDAVARGRIFPSANALFFNGTPSGSPDAVLPFQDDPAVGFQLLGSLDPLERDTFASATHYSMFLELPGISGEGTSPGPTGSIAIDSFTLANQTFSVVRRPDRATDDLDHAVATGRHFSSASVFFYDLANPGSPVLTFIFGDVLPTSFQLSGQLSPVETDGFVFESVTEASPGQDVPEPSSLMLLVAGSALAFCFAGRRVPHP